MVGCDAMKKAALIFNPVSGKKSFEPYIDIVKERLEHKGFTCNVYKTEYENHATEITKEISILHDLLIVAGGDGTFHEVLNGLMEIDNAPPVGYIPSGTTNDIGLSLGLSKNALKTLDIILKQTIVNMDVVKTNFGYFTYVSGIGKYIDISYKTSQKLKHIFGHLAYIFTGIKEFFISTKFKGDITFNGSVLSDTYVLLLLINSKKVAGFNMIKKPILDDGLIDVIMYRHIPFFNNIRFLFSFVFGIKKLPGVKHLSVKEMTVKISKKRQWNQDGELVGSGDQKIAVLPKALKIIINPKHLHLFLNQSKDHYEKII